MRTTPCEEVNVNEKPRTKFQKRQKKICVHRRKQANAVGESSCEKMVFLMQSCRNNEDKVPPSQRNCFTPLLSVVILLGVLPGLFFSGLWGFAYPLQQQGTGDYNDTTWEYDQLHSYDYTQVMMIVGMAVAATMVFYLLYHHWRAVPLWCWILLPVTCWLNSMALAHFLGQALQESTRQAHDKADDDHIGVLWQVWALILLPVVFLTMAYLLGTRQEAMAKAAEDADPAYARLEGDATTIPEV